MGVVSEKAPGKRTHVQECSRPAEAEGGARFAVVACAGGLHAYWRITSWKKAPLLSFTSKGKKGWMSGMGVREEDVRIRGQRTIATKEAHVVAQAGVPVCVCVCLSVPVCACLSVSLWSLCLSVCLCAGDCRALAGSGVKRRKHTLGVMEPAKPRQGARWRDGCLERFSWLQGSRVRAWVQKVSTAVLEQRVMKLSTQAAFEGNNAKRGLQGLEQSLVVLFALRAQTVEARRRKRRHTQLLPTRHEKHPLLRLLKLGCGRAALAPKAPQVWLTSTQVPSNKQRIVRTWHRAHKRLDRSKKHNKRNSNSFCCCSFACQASPANSKHCCVVCFCLQARPTKKN